jgi:hypothetical protein
MLCRQYGRRVDEKLAQDFLQQTAVGILQLQEHDLSPSYVTTNTIFMIHDEQAKVEPVSLDTEMATRLFTTQKD